MVLTIAWYSVLFLLILTFQTHFVLYWLVEAWRVLDNKANCRDCDQALISNALWALIPSIEARFLFLFCGMRRAARWRWGWSWWWGWQIQIWKQWNGLSPIPAGLWEEAFHLLQISSARCIVPPSLSLQLAQPMNHSLSKNLLARWLVTNLIPSNI